MYIMMKMSCPPDKIGEFAVKFAEFEVKYPLETRVGKPAFQGVYLDETGYHAMNMLEVPEGKMETIYANLYRQVNEFFGKVEGTHFEMKAVLSTEEALASLQA